MNRRGFLKFAFAGVATAPTVAVAVPGIMSKLTYWWQARCKPKTYTDLLREYITRDLVEQEMRTRSLLLYDGTFTVPKAGFYQITFPNGSELRFAHEGDVIAGDLMSAHRITC